MRRRPSFISLAAFDFRALRDFLPPRQILRAARALLRARADDSARPHQMSFVFLQRAFDDAFHYAESS